MATINYNDKGFFVIETSQAEIVSAHPLNRGICDRCNESSPIFFGFRDAYERATNPRR